VARKEHDLVGVEGVGRGGRDKKKPFEDLD